jgi:nucleotide-binding universal stress UspA family protein
MPDTYLVGFDGSASSERAIERATGDAEAGEARLVVAVVMAMPIDPLKSTPGLHVAFVPNADADTRALRSKMAKNEPPPVLEPTFAAAEQWTRRLGDRAVVRWRAGPPAQEIADLAYDEGAVRVYLGQHHHRFLDVVLSEDVTKSVGRHHEWELIVVD